MLRRWPGCDIGIWCQHLYMDTGSYTFGQYWCNCFCKPDGYNSIYHNRNNRRLQRNCFRHSECGIVANSWRNSRHKPYLRRQPDKPQRKRGSYLYLGAKYSPERNNGNYSNRFADNHSYLYGNRYRIGLQQHCDCAGDGESFTDNWHYGRNYPYLYRRNRHFTFCHRHFNYLCLVAFYRFMSNDRNTGNG